ncbi:MAG: VWA domain-containing protein, partial [Roseiflexaceae bacterium]|nr:VWA domain-containing protein [Roseiflexaceae bacterium]
MPILSLDINPPIAALGPQRQPQLCYALLTIGAAGATAAQAVNWAFVADASRSMRIPILDEAQFRAIIRDGGAQETLIDGVPVWQLAASLPPELKATVKSPLDHVARALHALLERLDSADRFALVACAEQALVLVESAPGDGRELLVRGIDELRQVNLGDATDLSTGLRLGLDQLRHGRSSHRTDRLVLLTDGFTEVPEKCLELAARAAAEGVAISTFGLGGEFQEALLTRIADATGGQARLVRRAEDI